MGDQTLAFYSGHRHGATRSAGLRHDEHSRLAYRPAFPDTTIIAIAHYNTGGPWNAVGPSTLFAPLVGGTLVPDLDIIFFTGSVNAAGEQLLAGSWPTGIPSDLTFWFRAWFQDAGGPEGWSATRGLSATTP